VGYWVLYFALALVFASSCLLMVGIYRLIFQDRILMAGRLAQLNKNKQTNPRLRDDLQLPLWQRIGKPLLSKVTRLFTHRMSSEKRVQLDKRLQAAGNPMGLDAGGFRLLQVIFTAVTVGAVLFRGYALGSSLKDLLLFLIVALACGMLLPEYLLSMRIKERRREVVHALPDVLDLLTVSVEAGLGFDLALVRVTERFPGVLAQELGRALQEMKLGRSRREALQDMADRVGAEDLSNFVRSLVQADQLGVGMGNILRLQSDEIRRKRRQRAEEQAMKAPVKMLFPLLFFIFPALFVVLLGPAMMQIFRHL
jgi:tight adherence protein C